MTAQTAHHLAYQLLAPIGHELGGGAHAYRCASRGTLAHCLGSISTPWQELRLRVGMHELADGTVRYSVRDIEVVHGPEPEAAP
jgi:hypothetical protein